MEEISKEINLTLFKAQQIIHAIYANAYMKFSPYENCNIDT